MKKYELVKRWYEGNSVDDNYEPQWLRQFPGAEHGATVEAETERAAQSAFKKMLPHLRLTFSGPVSPYHVWELLEKKPRPTANIGSLVCPNCRETIKHAREHVVLSRSAIGPCYSCGFLKTRA